MIQQFHRNRKENCRLFFVCAMSEIICSFFWHFTCSAVFPIGRHLLDWTGHLFCCPWDQQWNISQHICLDSLVLQSKVNPLDFGFGTLCQWWGAGNNDSFKLMCLRMKPRIWPTHPSCRSERKWCFVLLLQNPAVQHQTPYMDKRAKIPVVSLNRRGTKSTPEACRFPFQNISAAFFNTKQVSSFTAHLWKIFKQDKFFVHSAEKMVFWTFFALLLNPIHEDWMVSRERILFAQKPVCLHFSFALRGNKERTH